MTATAQKLDAAGWTMLLALSLLWAGSFIFIKLAAEIPVLTLVLARVALAAAALTLVVVASRRPLPRQPALYGRYLLVAVLNNAAPFVLIVYATPRIGAGAAAILNAVTPIFTVLAAHLLTADEKLTPAKLLGIGLGLCGVAVMVGPQALFGLEGQLLASLAMLAGTLSYAFSAVVGRSFRAVDPVVSAALQLSLSSLILAPAALAVDRPWTLPMPGYTALWAVVGLALLSTAFAYVLFFRIMARAGATNVMLVTLLIPPSAVVLAWFVLGERLGGAGLAGMALIGAGLVVVDGRLLRRRPEALSERPT